jgi:hypothetical protein
VSGGPMSSDWHRRQYMATADLRDLEVHRCDKCEAPAAKGAMCRDCMGKAIRGEFHRLGMFDQGPMLSATVHYSKEIRAFASKAAGSKDEEEIMGWLFSFIAEHWGRGGNA